MSKANFIKNFIKKDQQTRLYQLDRPVIAITGGIATGKSTFCRILKDKYKLEIIDADQLVKQIYQLPHIHNHIAQLAPACIQNEKIEFKILRQLFFKDQDLQRKIEHLIYQELPNQFLQQVKKMSQEFVIYDVPLLFEKNLQEQFDLTVLVYASAETQKARIKQRDQSAEDVIEAILQKQLPIESKKQLADVVIDNNNTDLNTLELAAKEFYHTYFN